jgi:lysophospholipid hydrolase
MESLISSQAAVDGYGPSVAPDAQRAVEFLEHVFPGVSRSAFSDVVACLEWLHVRGGELLIRHGEPATCVYLVVSGRLRVQVAAANDAGAHEIGRGEIVGEVALLTGERHTATIYAIRDSELLVISKAAFERFVEMYPAAMKQILRTSLLRLKRTVRSPERTVTTIAIVPAGADAPLSQFTARLVKALSVCGPTVHLDKAAFERGTGHSSSAGVPAGGCSATSWLHEQESKCRYVVYESDRTWSSWTRRCLRQADCVVTVGVAGTDPRLSAVEAEMASGGSAAVHLVLLHGDDTDQPRGTQAWLSARKVATHHHVRLGCDADCDRIARFVTGRAVAVVLGGGGARGMAHIGAIRAIRELGIPIDLIGGTSSGAAIAGAAASGFSCDRMSQVAQERLVAGGSLLDYTIPFVSLVSGRKISLGLQQTFASARIEDLWLNYFCVSTNLSRARMVVHREGLLWKAIRASVSLPGILPPVSRDGELLVDGGVMNKLPVDVMRGLCNGGRLLAVSVTAPGDGPRGDDIAAEYLSGWSILRRRLNPFVRDRQGPTIGSIVLCSMLAKSAQTQESLERQADLCVRIPHVPIGLFDFGSLAAIVEAGYRATLAQLRGWPSTSPGTSLQFANYDGFSRSV